MVLLFGQLIEFLQPLHHHSLLPEVTLHPGIGEYLVRLYVIGILLLAPVPLP
ncbi:hypothetical protein D9M73_281410 [compost metagenome]